jgi:valyl-tRNA synthetase/predicted alpha/beta hydrolase family esterase
MPLSPNYNPEDNESQIYSQWMEAKIGNPEKQHVKATTVSPQNGAKTHAILMPPPNLTGDLHAGHAFQHYLMDTLSRLARQRGEKDLWLPGVDHAGLQLEGVIDKLIKKGEFDEIIKSLIPSYLGIPFNEYEKENILKEDLPKFIKTNYPEVWLKCAWSKVNLWRDNQKNQSAILGDTPDYDRTLFTLDPQNLEMVNYAFQKYWQDGLIYKGSYLVNWSVGLQTALSDVAGEIEYEKRIDPFVTFEYRLFQKNINQNPFTTIRNQIKDGDRFSYTEQDSFIDLNTSIEVGTVRPETIFGDKAIAVNYKVFNSKYSQFEHLLIHSTGKCYLYAQIPLTNKFIPVILAGDDEVDPNFGSGSLKITPANDIVDYDIFNKYIGGDFESAIGRDGKLTSICGEFAGQPVNEARANVIKALVENDFVPKKKSNDIERKESKNYFGIEFVENINPEDYQINWNYEHNVTICERTKTVVEPLISEEFFISYHKEFSWTPIARDLNKTIANKGTKTTLQKLGIEAINQTNFHSREYKERGVNFLENIKDWCISRDLIWGHKMPVWYNLDLNPDRIFYSYEQVITNPELSKQFQIDQYMPEKYGSWVQEEKILDTWFSSCLWPLSTLKYPEFVRSNYGQSQSPSNYTQIATKSIENKTNFGSKDYGTLKPNIIFIHGGEIWKDRDTYRSKIESGELNWLWFKDEANSNKNSWKSQIQEYCNINKIQTLSPQFPNKTNADYAKWKMVFEQILPYLNPNTILIGHSLGSMFLTKYLSESELNFGKLFLVSGGLWDANDLEREDFNIDFEIKELELLKNLNDKIYIIHSTDDKIVNVQKSLDLKQKLPNANLIELENYGHLNSQCEELLKLIKNQLKISPQNDFQTFYPTQEMTTGKDIFYQWIVRMTALSYYFTAQIPYENLVITPTILDDKGKKMSKSLNNGMDPVAQINKYSSDAMRMAMLGGMIPDRNIKMGGRLADELCEKYRNFGNKMWNVARFFEYQEEKETK